MKRIIPFQYVIFCSGNLAYHIPNSIIFHTAGREGDEAEGEKALSGDVEIERGICRGKWMGDGERESERWC